MPLPVQGVEAAEARHGRRAAPGALRAAAAPRERRGAPARAATPGVVGAAAGARRMRAISKGGCASETARRRAPAAGVRRARRVRLRNRTPSAADTAASPWSRATAGLETRRHSPTAADRRPAAAARRFATAIPPERRVEPRARARRFRRRAQAIRPVRASARLRAHPPSGATTPATTSGGLAAALKRTAC